MRRLIKIAVALVAIYVAVLVVAWSGSVVINLRWSAKVWFVAIELVLVGCGVVLGKAFQSRGQVAKSSAILIGLCSSVVLALILLGVYSGGL